MKRIIIVALFCATSADVFAGTIYKCKNAAGVLQYQEKPCEKETESLSSWKASSSTSVEVEAGAEQGEDKPLILGQGMGGHYFVNGSVNDNYVNFVVDTGATIVALPLETAASSGVKCKEAKLMNTGNGVTQGCSVTIQKLKVGQFTLRYVDAVVMPRLSQPLLGMNVLRQFKVEQDNGQMRLSRKF